jgi:hypothetical protein
MLKTQLEPMITMCRRTCANLTDDTIWQSDRSALEDGWQSSFQTRKRVGHTRSYAQRILLTKRNKRPWRLARAKEEASVSAYCTADATL